MNLSVTSRCPIDGLQIAVREAGSGREPLLCLHGLMDTGASFARLIEALERIEPGRYRFIAPDWRGHGDSESQSESYWFPLYLRDLDALVDRLVGAETAVTLIAHSMGGTAASLYAGLRPERVARLVVLDSLNVPDSDPDDAPGRYRRWLDAFVEPPAPRVYADIDAARERIGRRYGELDDEALDRLAAQWTVDHDAGRRLRIDPWHQVTLPYGFRAAEAMAIWRQVSAPVLAIDGGQSPAIWFTPEDEMAERRACFARFERVVIDPAGHLLHVQHPEAVAEAIAGFLSGDATAN